MLPHYGDNVADRQEGDDDSDGDDDKYQIIKLSNYQIDDYDERGDGDSLI